MKRVVALFLCLFLIYCNIPLVTHAVGTNGTEGSANRRVSTIALKDGIYLEIVLEDIPQKSSNTQHGTKTYTAKNSSGTVLWVATLSGTFTYNGTSSSCTSANMSVSISNSRWYLVSKSAWPSGNKAMGSITMEQRYVGIKITEVSQNLTLTCDNDGNLS